MGFLDDPPWNRKKISGATSESPLSRRYPLLEELEAGGDESPKADTRRRRPRREDEGFVMVGSDR